MALLLPGSLVLSYPWQSDRRKKERDDALAELQTLRTAIAGKKQPHDLLSPAT